MKFYFKKIDGFNFNVLLTPDEQKVIKAKGGLNFPRKEIYKIYTDEEKTEKHFIGYTFKQMGRWRGLKYFTSYKWLTINKEGVSYGRNFKRRREATNYIYFVSE